MKIIVLFAMLFGSVEQAPRKVLNSFEMKYPSAELVSWSVVENLYHASFEHFGQQKVAVFECDGTWIQTNVLLQANELMFCIRDFLEHKHSKARIAKAYYVITTDLCEYHVLLDPSEGSQENDSSLLQLVFDENCAFMQKID